MGKKLIFTKFILLMFFINHLFAECGIDHSDDKDISDVSVKKMRVNSLVMEVPDDGNIVGIVITSCGQCKFGYKQKSGCSLTVKIGESIYPVKGTDIHDHGNAHGNDGFCNAVRVAWTEGNIRKGVFHAKSFTLVGN